MFAALLCAAVLLPDRAVAAADDAPPAPQGHYIFRSYGANDGLLNTTILQLLQDRHGFVWAGTDDGLYRYDGYRFDRFGVDEGLPSTAVDALHEDRQGVLWVGSRAGLSRWNGTGFERVPNSVAPGTVIRALADDSEGLWLAATTGLHIAGADLRFRPAPGWSAGEATALLVPRKAAGLWAARWDGQAHIAQRDADGWHSHALADGPTRERIDALAEDGQGRIWARSANQLWVLDAARRTFVHVATPIPVTGGERGYLSAGRRGDLWVSTNDGVMHREGERWSEVLAGDVIGARPVLEDREGSLWFGVRGLQRLAGRGIFHAYDISEGLSGNVVWNIVRDREQTLWVATQSGLARAVGERFETIPGTEARVIRSVVVAPGGKLFLAGIPGNGILSYEPARGRLREHALGLPISPGRITRLLLDRHGTLWAGTDNAGLLKADSGQTALRFSRETLPGGTPEEFVGDLHEEASGRVWAAGRHGLLLRENGNWRRFTTADGLRQNDISHVRATRNGDVLFVYGGPNGYARARYERGTLRILRQVDSASTRSADEVFLIGEDTDDNVWVGTGRGIDRVTPTRTEHFNTASGLVGEDTANMAFLAEPNGDVWFGVVGGLMRFDAAAYRALPRLAAPPSALLDVRIGDRPFAPAAHAVRVPFAANSFQVRFAGLTFLGEHVVQYKTRLEGLESKDSVSDAHEARYAALPPRRYRFEVAARAGPLGAWGAPATFSFQVLPPWYRTWWAYLGFAALIFTTLWLSFHWRSTALRRRNVELAGLVSKRTEELSSANAALLEQSVTDPLTGLRNRRFLLTQIRDDIALVDRRHHSRDRARTTGVSDLIFLMVDIDHFKEVNDRYGHGAGDRVLEQMRDILLASCRESDTPVRWGGEEFLIVGRFTDREFAGAFAERIRSRVALHAFDLGEGKTVHRTCSIGFACYPFFTREVDRLNWEEVVNLADQCLYAAKHSGRNAWVGVQSTDKPPGGDFSARARCGLAPLIAEGILRVQTSVKEMNELQWK